MTATELQRIVVRLSNASWVRYWLQWSHPMTEPWLMAIQVRNMRLDGFGPVEVPALVEKGFQAVTRDVGLVYVIRRTDEDGLPFRI